MPQVKAELTEGVVIGRRRCGQPVTVVPTVWSHPRQWSGEPWSRNLWGKQGPINVKNPMPRVGSKVGFFAGLWLDGVALSQGNLSQVLNLLQQGLTTR